jgi:hypothetical protein
MQIGVDSMLEFRAQKWFVTADCLNARAQDYFYAFVNFYRVSFLIIPKTYQKNPSQVVISQNSKTMTLPIS